MDFDEGEQFYTVVYSGKNLKDAASVNSSLKFIGTKKEGGFVVFDEDKVYFEMEWRDSACLEFVDKDNTVLAQGTVPAKVQFSKEVEYSDFKLV